MIKGNKVVASYYNNETPGYGSLGKAGKNASPKVFEKLINELVIPKVVHLEGNKVTKMSTPLLDGFDCYYGTADGDMLYVCFSQVDVPKILPLRVLTDLKLTTNESNAELAENIQTIVRQFHEELLSFHDPGAAEATEQDLQDIIHLMNDNIDKFLQRQERVSLLVDRTSKLNQSSYNFKRKAVRIKTKMWWQNVKLCSTLIAATVLVILVIVVAVHFL